MSNNHGDIVIEAPAGYKWDEGTLKKITYVAEAGGVKYDSLQKAIDAAKSKAVVTMLADTRENVTISTPYNGLMLHASAAALGGRAYLFSGPCGRGKSTHTRLWQQTFGEAVQVFNDDKPVLAVGAASVDFNGMLTLNESGALLWRALEQGADRPTLLAALTAEYDVSDAQAEQDIDEFLSTLQKAGCLEA